MEFVARLKQLEAAWQQGFITGHEYHGLLDYFLSCLRRDEGLCLGS